MSCKLCNRDSNEKGHDFCIQDLPNVKDACCGHGDKTPYLVTDDNVRQEFEFSDNLRNDMITWINKRRLGLIE